MPKAVFCDGSEMILILTMTTCRKGLVTREIVLERLFAMLGDYSGFRNDDILCEAELMGMISGSMF